MTKEEIESAMRVFPFLPGWLEEIERTPEDMQYISLNRDMERDLEREARERSHYKMYMSLGPVEATLVCTDGSRYSKAITETMAEASNER